MAKEMKRLDREVAGWAKIETYGAMQRELDLTRTERYSTDCSCSQDVHIGHEN